MKADQSGTPSEQARHAAGWLTPTQAQGADNRCRDCLYFLPGWRLHSVCRRIGDKCIEMNLATKPTATCRNWEARS